MNNQNVTGKRVDSVAQCGRGEQAVVNACGIRLSTQREEQAAPLPSWMSNSLIEDTSSFWSKDLGRTVDKDEAIQILLNVKRIAEVLVSIEKETE